MPSKRRSLLAAAGNAGSDPLYVEDVFSTYLYTGTGSTLVINNGIALGDTNYGASVEFNGTSDSLTRASDFSGNADGNSFTFSCWCFKAVDGVTLRIFTNGQSSGTDSGLVVYAGNNDLVFMARNSADTTLFEAHAYTNILPLNVWTNVLISVDLSSASNRYIYMNDVDVTSSFTFSQYTNGNINFTTTTQNIGKADGISSQLWQGKLSSLFLDYTYRDLSVTGNRRLFITADGQPAANQASLSPIMFMPLDDTNAIGKNLGTGGDFTANGPPTALSQGGPYIESGYGQGGMVWCKMRDNTLAYNHNLFDTNRGVRKFLVSNTTAVYGTADPGHSLTSFNSNGFTLGTNWNNENRSSTTNVSWTFRKAEKFFDVVTWTGNGVSGREIAHNLGAVPGFIITKRTDGADNWKCYHVGNPSPAEDHVIELDNSNAAGNDSSFNDTAPTDTHFTVSGGGSVNGNGMTYVAYLFASDAGGFGDDGSENIIKCGSFNAAANTEVDLGFEPQFIMFKNTTSAGNWQIVDMMRGMPVGSDDRQLMANLTNAESDNGLTTITATGFTWLPSASGNTYIYIAIRRPMKTPEAGTEVFNIATALGTNPAFVSGFVTDMGFNVDKTAASILFNESRLQGGQYLNTRSTASEVAEASRSWDYMNGMIDSQTASTNNIGYMFKRATGFMDVVAYTGNSGVSTVDNKSHNLGVVPELIIFKDRSGLDDWQVYHSAIGETKQIRLNSTVWAVSSAYMNNTAPTSSVFTANGGFLNSDGVTYIAYLFATLAGVSKVGSYTGTAADLNVDCGFTAGARFILIKHSNSTGDWYTYDSLRGISAGNDPYLLMNSAAAEVTNTDYIDPLNAGFTVTSNASSTININGGTFIFLAIA